MSNQRFSNRAASVLAANLTSGATSLTVATGAGTLFPDVTPASYYFRAVIQVGDLDSDAREYIRVTAKAGDVFTIERGAEGSTAQAWAAGATIAHVATGASLADMAGMDDIAAVNTALGGKESSIAAGTVQQFWRGDKTWVDFATTVRAAVLTGYAVGTNAAVAATDTVMGAIGKLQAQVNNTGNAILAQVLTGISFASSATITAADTVLSAFGKLQAQISAKYDKTGGAIGGRAYTTPVISAFSATPTFDAAASNVFQMGALTANVTALSLSNPVDGQTVNIRLVQDATGGRTVALAANIKADGSPQVGASRASWLVVTYVASATRWEGAWSPVPA